MMGSRSISKFSAAAAFEYSSQGAPSNANSEEAEGKDQRIV